MKNLSTLLITILLCTTALAAQSYKTDSGTATFLSKVPLHTFEGTSDKLVGLINLEDNTIDFYIDLETLDTGNGKRDKDMRLTLETKKYPFGEFFGKLLTPFDVNSGTVQPVTAKGVFKIHGKEKEIEVQGTLQKTDQGLVLTAAWILNLLDYDIVPPRLLIVKVDEEQEITINATLTPQS